MAGASLLDVCPVGRTIETTFESVAIYFVENISTLNSRRTLLKHFMTVPVTGTNFVVCLHGKFQPRRPG